MPSVATNLLGRVGVDGETVDFMGKCLFGWICVGLFLQNVDF